MGDLAVLPILERLRDLPKLPKSFRSGAWLRGYLLKADRSRDDRDFCFGHRGLLLNARG
jgi:hypothetical protein